MIYVVPPVVAGYHRERMRNVYLDNNATTAVLPEVFEAMRPYFSEQYGNPSSVHRQGSGPAAAMRAARATIAGFLGCSEGEVVFTSCGTESDNLAIRGILEGERTKMHIVTTAVEHPAVLNPFRRMKAMGHELTILGVDARGMLDLDELRSTLREDTALASVMYANNETGVVFPMEKIAAICRERGVPLHVDAVQAIGKLPIDLSTLPVDMLALSAHKFHGPKGVGAMFVRQPARYHPILLGGSQERGRRPGTENVAGIAAMAKACELAAQHMDDYNTRVAALRDRMETGLLERIPDSEANGNASPRLPNTSNLLFRGVDAVTLTVVLDEVGICASAGSACKSGAGVASPVLTAMGRSPEEAASSVRLSLSTMTSDEDIDYVLEQIPAAVARMRSA
jgi:cysteine desulfurase